MWVQTPFRLKLTVCSPLVMGLKVALRLLVQISVSSDNGFNLNQHTLVILLLEFFGHRNPHGKPVLPCTEHIWYGIDFNMFYVCNL